MGSDAVKHEHEHHRWRRAVAAALLLLAFAVTILSHCVAVASQTSATTTDFSWTPERAPTGPLVVVVSVPAQQAFVYRNGVRIGKSIVSTGMQGHETPGGVFRILQKRRDHQSNLYEGLSMPFLQRLTWDGIALHAGDLPGYPASHGCVVFPQAFAEQLFSATSLGDLVVIVSEDSLPSIVSTASMLAPVDADTGSTGALARSDRDFEWMPERAHTGAISIVLSTSDRQIVVLRNAVEIGRSDIGISVEPPSGTRAYLLLAGVGPGPSRVVPNRAVLRWQKLPVAPEAAPFELADAVASGQISIPVEFARRVYDELQPGATVIVTDERLSAGHNDTNADPGSATFLQERH